MIIKCKFCGRLFSSFNKHRTKCYECSEAYPMEARKQGEMPFVRVDEIIKDKARKLT